MPTVHYCSGSLFAKYGVNNPPRKPEQIKTRLKRDRDHDDFSQFASSAEYKDDSSSIDGVG